VRNFGFRISDFGFSAIRSPQSAIRNLFLLVSLLLAVGCGKIGDPLPPFIRIPTPVSDLAARQNGHSLFLTWTNPAKNIDGSSADDLEAVQVFSNNTVMTTVEVNGPGQAQSFEIPLGSSPGGQRTFAVQLKTSRGKLSQISNSASVTPVDVPGRVAGLRAIVDQRRITLLWDKPPEHPELANAYLVNRIDPADEPQTVPDTRYEDNRYVPGRRYSYQVTAVRNVQGGGLIPGTEPAPITVVAEDKTPPQVPTGLDIVPSDTGAFLAWNDNSEADLAGYRIFRSESAKGPFQPVTDRLNPTSGFFDPAYRPGLYYAISAVDEFGNESARSAPLAAP
jgi:hypothetical protein